MITTADTLYKYFIKTFKIVFLLAFISYGILSILTLGKLIITSFSVESVLSTVDILTLTARSWFIFSLFRILDFKAASIELDSIQKNLIVIFILDLFILIEKYLFKLDYYSGTSHLATGDGFFANLAKLYIEYKSFLGDFTKFINPAPSGLVIIFIVLLISRLRSNNCP